MEVNYVAPPAWFYLGFEFVDNFLQEKNLVGSQWILQMIDLLVHFFQFLVNDLERRVLLEHTTAWPL